jgi:hypothetical protein
MSDPSLYEKVGFILADVKNIGQKVDGVMEKVNCVDKKIIDLSNSTISTNEYTQKSNELNSRISNLESKISSSKPQNKNFLYKLKNNLGVVIAIITVASVLGASGYKLAHFIVNVEKAIQLGKNETKESVTALRRDIRKLKLPYYRDSVVSSDEFDEPTIKLNSVKLKASKR